MKKPKLKSDKTSSGLAADLVRFKSEGLEVLSTENHLRPETVEFVHAVACNRKTAVQRLGLEYFPGLWRY
jgi:hypothetical protein